MNNLIHLLERRLGRLYERTPDLPRDVRRWLAVNAWWIVLVFAILGAIAEVANIPRLTNLDNVQMYNYLYPNNTTPPGATVASTIVTIALGMVMVVLLFLAVQPLRELKLRGWRLLLLTEFVTILSLVVSFIITINDFKLFGLIWGLIISALELYIIFKLRPEFGGRVANAKEAEIVGETKKPRK